jgi:hypothetical protein
MVFSLPEARPVTKAGIRPAPGIKSALGKHWRLAGVSLLLVAVTIGAVSLRVRGSRSAAAVVPYPHELAQVSFAVAGDVIPHEAIRAAASAAETAHRAGARSSAM